MFMKFAAFPVFPVIINVLTAQISNQPGEDRRRGGEQPSLEYHHFVRTIHYEVYPSRDDHCISAILDQLELLSFTIDASSAEFLKSKRPAGRSSLVSYACKIHEARQYVFRMIEMPGLGLKAYTYATPPPISRVQP
jgi:hypothetical protein